MFAFSALKKRTRLLIKSGNVTVNAELQLHAPRNQKMTMLLQLVPLVLTIASTCI